ncbi:uncharacterized protein F5891DRAFT_1132329 [Suillus fuscotomentosus]|uniref:Integrase core domain-containing protein n=1 Tax=Suillus fuscotomentosus TaxID=1912939 RepID=A0AAD4HD75_9AGAM|nr:uncharacterized protein F5891DRAFT_1132329 [Suillus fuscotomentosus]KAG1886899.1 hypothetical protein F5891DRAFT_1132329 [Suillus fuscotomentosus]
MTDWELCLHNYYRSTRNSRIERLWVEVGTQFVRRWRAFFSRLERLHGLDIEKMGHLWLLQGLFLDAINDDCKTFQEEWNLHPIAGPSTNNKSPQDLQLISQVTLGIYRDNCEGVHPDTIERYHGTHGREQTRCHGQTGAGHPDDEDTNSGDQLVSQIEEDQEQNKSPFVTQDDENLFFSTVEKIVVEGIIPEGYGLLPGEQDDEDAAIIEVLQFGRRGTKSIVVSLSDSVWEARATLWCQGLSALSLFKTERYF